jgi:predicted GH43/DUF377 family glycosyl hydrolase
VDLNPENPSEIINISHSPVLDCGSAGCFDDNGVILGDVIKYENKFYMFYIGFQLVKKAKFLAFTGLAISQDNGNSFQRLKETPIMDRSPEGVFFRAIHSIAYEKGIWKIWYAIGSSWTLINNASFPSYKIAYQESLSYDKFSEIGEVCIDFERDEYRIGRPRVYKTKQGYTMYYTKGTISGEYFPGVAYSQDGKTWERKDKDFPLALSSDPNGWDSMHLSYPSIISYKDKTYMFYNGNDMGRNGFGYAEQEAN